MINHELFGLENILKGCFFSPRTIRDGDDDIEMINKYKFC